MTKEDADKGRNSRASSEPITSTLELPTRRRGSLDARTQTHTLPLAAIARCTHVEVSRELLNELNRINNVLEEKNQWLVTRLETLSGQNGDLASECARLRVQSRYMLTRLEDHVGLRKQCFELVVENIKVVKQLVEAKEEVGKYQAEQRQLVNDIRKELESEPEICQHFSDILQCFDHTDLRLIIQAMIRRFCLVLGENTKPDEQQDRAGSHVDSVWGNGNQQNGRLEGHSAEEEEDEVENLISKGQNNQDDSDRMSE